MRYGYLGKLKTFSFIGLMAVTGGCDSNAALPPQPLAAIEAPQGETPEARTQTDLARNRVWLLTREGVFLQDRALSDKLVKLQIPGWHWAGAPYGCLPDLALGPRGEAVVTSDVVPTLWRSIPKPSPSVCTRWCSMPTWTRMSDFRGSLIRPSMGRTSR